LPTLVLNQSDLDYFRKAGKALSPWVPLLRLVAKGKLFSHLKLALKKATFKVERFQTQL
jgi:hypothetical protein